MMIILRIIALLLRIYSFKSPIVNKLSNIFFFKSLITTKELITEYNYSSQFISHITRKMLFFIELNNEYYNIIIFSIYDIAIGIILANILKTNDNDQKYNKYVEIIYLFNPITILNCSRLNLGIFMNILNLLFFKSSNNYIFYLLYILSSCCTPQYFIMNTIYLIIRSIRKNNYMMIIISITIVTVIIFKTDLLSLYMNYVYVKDTLPNMNMIWALLPETFLKYQDFSIYLLIIYQLILNIGILLFIIDSKYKNSLSLSYSLLFTLNHLFDRYPSENDYVILILMITQHYDIISNKYTTLSLMCSFAGYTLIYSRGYPFKEGKTGSSNYLYFQNLTYNSFIAFVFLSALFSVFEYHKENKIDNKVEENNNIVD